MLPIVALLVFVGCDIVLGLDRVEPKIPILTATAGNNNVELSWVPDPNSNKFHVKRGEVSGVHEFLAEVTYGKTSYKDVTAMNGITYFYVLTAFGGDGETAPSNERTATPAATILTAFVTSAVLGSLVTGASGLFGVRIETGGSPITVKTLGRAFAPGNNQIHLVKLVDSATNADVPGGFVAVSMAGGSVGDFIYAQLTAPPVLNANATYFLVSQETAGADQFYNHDTTVETTDVASVTSSVRSSGSTYTADSAGPKAYGPLSFQY